MAIQTVNCTFDFYAITNYWSPDQVIPVEDISDGETGYMLLSHAKNTQWNTKRVKSIDLCFRARSYGSDNSVSISAIKGYWDSFQVTHNTMPQIERIGSVYIADDPSFSDHTIRVYTESQGRDYLNDLYNYGVAIDVTLIEMYTPMSDQQPYFLVTYDDTAVVPGISASVNGSTAYATGNALATAIQWDIQTFVDGVMSPFVPMSTIFVWRVKDTVTEYTINCGSGYTYTIPAGTFPSGTIEFKIKSTVNTGAICDTGWKKMTVYPAALSGLSPTSGYLKRDSAAIFSWDIQCKRSEAETVSVSQNSGTFRWRNGSSGSISTIQLGTAKSITVSAGTFPKTSQLQWSVLVNAPGGIQLLSDWMTLTTEDAIPIARPISPNGAILDGLSPVTFVWEHSISSGTEQTAANLEYSTESKDGPFTTLANITGAEKSYTAPGTEFQAGELFWRVRTYNSDNVSSPWSQALRSIVVSAPDTPAITVVSMAPRFKIRWSQDGQQAYEVSLNGDVVYKAFGSESEYQHPEYLSDGTYSISVRIQNRFGLWSGYATAAITIENVSGASISLSTTGGVDAALSWSTSGDYQHFQVLRNGEVIHETAEARYTDQYFLGDAVYQIRGIWDGDNYGLSNEVPVTVTANTLMISAAEDDGWLHLPYWTSSMRSSGVNASTNVQYIALSGEQLPMAEIGDGMTQTYSFRAAFLTTDPASRLLENLMGKAVYIKDPNEGLIYGVLGGYSKETNEFYKAYQCTVTCIQPERR